MVRSERPNMYDFYERLMNGEKAEDIAKSITEELNKAQKKKDEAEKLQKSKEQQKDDAEVIANAINGYISVYHPKIKATITADDLIKTLDMAERTALAFDGILEGLDAGKEKVKDKAKDIDAVIDSFLEKMGW